jgi:hypothetical protein
MPLTPEKRDSFIKLFDEQFGEGAAEQMFKAHDLTYRLCGRGLGYFFVIRSIMIKKEPIPD